MLKSRERFFFDKHKCVVPFCKATCAQFFAYNLYLKLIHNICKNKSYYSMMKSKHIYTLFRSIVEKCSIEYKRLK